MYLQTSDWSRTPSLIWSSSHAAAGARGGCRGRYRHGPAMCAEAYAPAPPTRCIGYFAHPVRATSVIRCEETSAPPLATLLRSMFMSTLVKAQLCWITEIAGTGPPAGRILTFRPGQFSGLTTPVRGDGPCSRHPTTIPAVDSSSRRQSAGHPSTNRSRTAPLGSVLGRAGSRPDACRSSCRAAADRLHGSG